MPAIIEPLESRRMLDGGTLVGSFGSSGRRIFPFVDARLIGIRHDGQLVLQRYPRTRDGTTDSLIFTRHHDPDFRSVTPPADFPGPGTLSIIRINPTDGRIAYVSDFASPEVTVLTPDGALDTTWDGDGVKSFAVGGPAAPNNSVLELEWQGSKLVVAGGGAQLSDERLRLTRHNPDGSLDTTFGAGGNLIIPTPQSHRELHSFEVSRDGSLFLLFDQLASATRPTRTVTVVTKLTANGALDTGYGTGGTAQVSDVTYDGNVAPRTLAWHVAPDNGVYHLINQGTRDVPTGFDVTRLNTDGSFGARASFSYDRASANPMSTLFPNQVATQPDGKVILIGDSRVIQHARGIVGLNADLTIDTTYGDNGTFTSDLGPLHDAFPAPVDEQGKVILTGKLLRKTGTFQAVQVNSGREFPTVTLNSKGTLLVTGTGADENASIYIRPRDGRLVAWSGSNSLLVAPSKVKRIIVLLNGGNDTLTVAPGIRGVYADGGDGNDTLNGGENGDVLLGGPGADHLFGHNGDDRLIGNGGADYLLGGAGKDDLFGQAGRDTLSGAGGNDRLFGGSNRDFVYGGAGVDAAADEDNDHLDSIEALLNL